MRIAFAGLLFCGLALAQLEDIPVGSIDFYGLEGLDANRLRAALSVKPGDMFAWPGTRDRVRRELTQAAGRSSTHFAPVCCDSAGRLMLYIGFSTTGAEAAYRPKPRGEARLPESLVKLYDEFMDALPEALKKAAGMPDDYSKGYSLSSYPPTRAIQMRMREAALAHEDQLLRALQQSAEDKHRIVAAHLSGYTRHSPEQVAALVDASRDANDTVRNNATRALAVLAATPEFALKIPAEPFIDKLNSAAWSDRNKALMLLAPLTRARNARVLAQLKAKALPALVEMAQWQFVGHSGGPIRLLGRIAGMDESTIDRLADVGDEAPVIAAIQK